MTTQEIKGIVAGGETLTVEFKRAGNGPEHDTYETICAFLNRQGGDILLGVEDEGTVVGVPTKVAATMVKQIVNVMFTENANKVVNPGVITPSNLRPYSKNPIIANFFHQIGRADELGSGVRNLYHYVKLYSGVEPIFDEEDVFRLTVPLAAEFSPEKSTTRKTTRKTTEKTTEKERIEGRIRQLVAESPTVSMSEMAVKLRLTEDGVYYHVKKLRSAGKLRRIGGRKAGYWQFL